MYGKGNRTTVVNVFKPPDTKLQGNFIPAFSSPCIYVGDFNSHSTTWVYQSTNSDGETLESWTSAAGLQLLYDPEQPDSLYSGRLNSITNPDLAFASISPSPERLVLNPFPKSQHRPSLISPVNPIRTIPSKAVKRWNFRKANQPRFMHLVDIKFCRQPDPASADLDTAYTSIYKVLLRLWQQKNYPV